MLRRRNLQLPALLQRGELLAARREPPWLAGRLPLSWHCWRWETCQSSGLRCFAMMGGVGLRAEITQLAASLCSDLHASNRKASLPALVLARGPSTSSSGSFSFSQGFLCWLWQAQTRVEMGQGWQVVEMFHRAAVSVGLFVGAGLVKPWDSASSSSLVYNVANPFALFVFHESFLITGGCSSGQGPLVLMATRVPFPALVVWQGRQLSWLHDPSTGHHSLCTAPVHPFSAPEQAGD